MPDPTAANPPLGWVLFKWINNEHTYMKPVAVKPCFKGRRHGW